MIGIYSGSFDPFTLGHASVLVQALDMFDTVYVAIGVNAAKTPFLQHELRVSIISNWANSITNGDKIRVISVQDEFLVDTARRLGATLIRGIRNAQDYEYEQTVYDVNRVIEPAVPTVYFFTNQEYRNISSSLVRGMIGFQNWESRVANFVPDETLKALKRRDNPKFS